MKSKILNLAIGLLALSCSVYAQQEDQQTQSPYFLVSNGEEKPINFILESTSADVNITGPIADVTINQSYRNSGQNPIEAIYVFPASNRAAVYSMEMKIGDRIIKAKIKEKQEARQSYEKAKQEGKRASLLEQQNPNVFQMNVANILPGDVVELTLKYNEFLIPEDGDYSFVYPTVVGPRYTGESKSNKSYTANPHLSEGSSTPYEFDIDVNLSSPVHIQKAGSISHKVDINFTGKNSLSLRLDPSEKDGGNRDFIFEYSMSGGELVAGTSFYDHGDEKFFLSVIEPPKHIAEEAIVPREFIFIVDVSGSMHGFPLETSKELMNNLLSQLRPIDKFNVLLFESNSKMMFPGSVPVSVGTIERATSFVNQQYGGGGTSMLSAIKKAMAVPKEENTSRSFVIVTDGYVSVEREAFEYIENNLGNANFFSFGIGSGVNRYIIDGIAHVGRGEPFVITSPEYAEEKAEKFKKYIEKPLLTNVTAEINGMDVYDVTPKHIPDLLAERPIYIFGKYKGTPSGEIIISGQQGTGTYRQAIPLAKENVKDENVALRYLWAREKIRNLSDFQSIDNNESEKKQIVQLGLKYNVLTSFTSFLAIEDIPVLANAENTKTVKQALPLPQGVSNLAISGGSYGSYAIGFEMGADEIVGATAEVEEALLFVNILDDYDPQLATTITRIIEDAFRYTDEEARAVLNENKLTIVKVNGTLVIIDKDKVLTQEMKDKIIMGLSELNEQLSEGQTIKVELIWL